MHKNSKNIFATFLLVIFLLPITIKILDVAFHEHEHIICHAKNEKHLHQFKKNCSISSFSFSTFMMQKRIFIFPFYPKTTTFLVSLYTKKHIHFLHFLFLLRAPPFATCITQ